MIRIDRVVTRGGDKGETSLGDGTRVPKDSARIEAIGAVDEGNAAIGLLAVVATEHQPMLTRIQNDLFDIGADLCVPGDAGERRLRLTDVSVRRLEQDIEALNRGLTELRSFVLPGGTEAAARAHQARTLARRAERAVVAVSRQEKVNPVLVRYLNRLSDALFVLGRVLNGAGTGDVLWRPGAGASQDSAG
jgi:cob(I)alamin adenosyltransferase